MASAGVLALGLGVGVGTLVVDTKRLEMTTEGLLSAVRTRQSEETRQT